VLRGRQIIPIDLKRAGIDPSANFALQSGDVVNISEPDVIRIQVAGAVNKQGALRIAPGSTLLDALNRGAGGLTTSLQPQEARISIVRTLSRGASLVGLSSSNAPVVLSNALDGGSTNGDATASIATAPAEVAAPQTQVVGDREVISVDAVALLQRNDLRQNITLQDGDLVSVTQVKYRQNRAISTHRRRRHRATAGARGRGERCRGFNSCGAATWWRVAHAQCV